MVVRELRIGNYFKTRSGQIEKVYNIYKNERGVCMVSDIPIDFIDPIHLTEEWLLKFGFQKTTTEETYGNGVIGIFFYKGEGNYSVAKFKHIHQLQNLYYTLTGEELTIKEIAK